MSHQAVKLRFAAETRKQLQTTSPRWLRDVLLFQILPAGVFELVNDSHIASMLRPSVGAGHSRV